MFCLNIINPGLLFEQVRRSCLRSDVLDRVRDEGFFIRSSEDFALDENSPVIAGGVFTKPVCAVINGKMAYGCDRTIVVRAKYQDSNVNCESEWDPYSNTSALVWEDMREIEQTSGSNTSITLLTNGQAFLTENGIDSIRSNHIERIEGPNEEACNFKTQSFPFKTRLDDFVAELYKKQVELLQAIFNNDDIYQE